jgi:hypothetical protein
MSTIRKFISAFAETMHRSGLLRCVIIHFWFLPIAVHKVKYLKKADELLASLNRNETVYKEFGFI